ncbi:ORF97 [Spodoptera eridania nucleopolyhedrovirus]|uniref:ORF97 n=1 Tax=Spodoptera eridania nucleopolyhedrovirus TaxID=2315721 RepID=A0A346TQ34_9ABAC|nr:ORF97 [Spodoptera eridania nucleopolyhedrovirus]AXU41694.1 ORF97 [Spodoptera eridania nucleopolyhedrovirus]
MKSWMKAVVLLLILYVIVFHCCTNRCGNSSDGNNDNNDSKFFTPGPTCDTYYYGGRDLRRCPPNKEFDYRFQDCVNIGAYDGCYANAVTKYTNLYARFKAMKKERY